MNITLLHPLYGAKIAINETEIKNDENNGWTRYNPETSVEVAHETVIDAPKRKYTRKVTDQPVEQPNEAIATASEESEGT